MLRFFLIFIVFLGLLSFSAVGLVWFALEDTPRISVKGAKQLDDADQVDALMKQVQRSIKLRDEPSSLDITEAQLDSLKGLVQRAAFDMSGDATLSDGVGVLQASFAIPFLSQKKFINAEIWVADGAGVNVQKISVGRLTVPGGLATKLGEWGVNFATSSNSGSELLASVKRVGISKHKVDVELNPLASLLNELRRIDTGETTPRNTFVEVQTAEFLRIIESYERENGTRRRSLNDYINVVFASAAQKNDRVNAASINEAAILSLAIFAGHYRIGTFVGDVQLDIDKPSKPNHMPTLNGRVDLSQHFIISAALNLISKRGLSLAIGEFKELMDRAIGGSGYSFVDLAADRAGVKFAVEATNPDKAYEIQQRIALGATESDYFPNTQGLVEGLNKQAFNDRFGSVDSEAYQREVDVIISRINALGLYRFP